MQQKIKSALISVFNKEGLKEIIPLLRQQNITIYSTGGTQKFIEENGGSCVAVESLTGYPSILGGRVKTLHPVVFGGFLARRDVESDLKEMEQYKIPAIDLVIVDLYPFEETVKSTSDEAAIIEKIDIGGPSMIRAAAKNFKHAVVVADKNEYKNLREILSEKNAETSLEERKEFARKAFDVCTRYDIAISNYFNHSDFSNPFSEEKKTLRYGENPHQQGFYVGNLDEIFEQLSGKELSYNNLVDIDGALQLMNEFENNPDEAVTFAIFKHTNVCGIAQRDTVSEAFAAALAGDPESAFGGILIANTAIDKKTAEALKDLFFEVLIAPSFDQDALGDLKIKKNRILLKLKKFPEGAQQSKRILNGLLIQDNDKGNFAEWKDEGARNATQQEKEDLIFANLVCKHLKSNAIAIVKNRQLLGKGCGQTSRVDSMKQAIAKANQFEFDLKNAVVASDAFFPFDDCVKLAYDAGITAFIQPGGSIRDKDSIRFCKENNLVMVITGMRHFKH
ncbi:bifunctional phosphoribosylaminoimidazolecarboxamide formyltransferase/IMP cyclohydrolase PurH [Hanamia caeni]|uniref:Bifunctional purine biosynthesis protein PurH n=1 Tax=Hanamia caeni TaxID=2294116 RepID=A0A3M9NML9_9BACT|nr:bifunctional phosphoribosylaminoimidazolecarboxamide formyltransferase/IMP cyclohydrolase [Hanamia caeni]RNI39039.1 bifunctional phosphoribosylaminoimidazolecarboxamide formyltransferase/IMP cyclohydrolase PurH [Hanamia caeni]